MKKETLRQITALLLATAMMASLSGCAVSGSSSTAVDQKDEKKVDMMSSSSGAASVAAQIETEELESEINFKKNEADELGLTEQQLNSFSMLYYLTITADEIRTAKNNRLVLDDIYTSLLNDINPGAIDETTQDHLTNLRDVIKNFLGISQKRERLQYLYNQDKASAIRSAVPNPIAVLSVAQTMNWAKLAMAVVYTVVDSYNSYKSAEKDIDQDFLMSGWELDDEETETIQKTRERAFDYMVDMVQAYDLDETILVSWKRELDFRQLGPLYKIYLRLPKDSPIRFPNADRLSHHWTRPDLCIIEATYKERGIDYLVSSRQLSREQLICFGDGDNDVSMFDYCQTSICMGNGTERAKAHASFITLPIEQEGIAYALDQLHYFEGGK